MDRAALKRRAKSVLSQNYWTAVFACFIFSLLMGESSVNLSSSTTLLQYENTVSPIVDRIGFTETPVIPYISFFIMLFALIGLLFVFNVFFVNPLIIGKANFFLKARTDGYKAEYVFQIFRGDGYTNALKAMFMKKLFIFLGSLLIIPGIYFTYAYYFVPQIVSDDPTISWKDALAKSKEITDGHKFELFVLELSFIGWYLLGALFIFGSYFVNPYFESTIAEAYVSLKGDQKTKQTSTEFTINEDDLKI